MSDQELQTVTAAEALPGTSLGKILLALYNEHARELSWLEPARLQHLVDLEAGAYAALAGGSASTE